MIATLIKPYPTGAKMLPVGFQFEVTYQKHVELEAAGYVAPRVLPSSAIEAVEDERFELMLNREEITGEEE